MNKEPLNNNDKKAIKSDIIQGIVSFVMVLLVVIVVYFTGLFFINKFEYNDKYIIIYTSIVSVITGFLFYNKLKNPIGDYRAKSKQVLIGIITDKKESTNYGWHTSALANKVSQPKLVIYYLQIDDATYFVEKELFEQFEIGDKVKVSLTSKTNKLLNMKSV